MSPLPLSMTRRFNMLPQPQPSDLAQRISRRLPGVSVYSIDEVLQAAETEVETANPDRLAAIIRITLTEMRSKRAPKP